MLQFAGYFTPTDSLRVIDGTLDSPSFTAVYEREGEPVAVFAMDSPRLFTRCRKQIEAALNSVDATTAS
jgi:3-phenylpropionate/trans-cinnamate dioxygenase ferredoxin reductase subunit